MTAQALFMHDDSPFIGGLVSPEGAQASARIQSGEKLAATSAACRNEG